MGIVIFLEKALAFGQQADMMVFTRILLVALALSASSVAAVDFESLTFSNLDANEDGSVTADDIATIISNLGVTDVNTDQIAAYIASADTDGSGSVDEDEFYAAVTGTSEAQFESVFSAYDTDSDGSISADELAAMQGVTSDMAAMVIASTDTDGDGEVG